MPLKPAITIQDQIALLKHRGMIVDEKTTDAFLADNQYFRLNIYFHKFMNSRDHFTPGTRFSQIANIYENDRWLRQQILKLLEPIEIKTRTQIAYHLGIKYGSDAFYNLGIYKDQTIGQGILQNFSNELNRNKLDPVVKHHTNNYGGMFPVWVVVEFLSFNALSKFYSQLLEVDKKTIAKTGFAANEYFLGQWLHVLSVIRNICAHYGYLYKRVYPLRPKIEKSTGWDPNKNDELFSMFLVLHRLSTQSSFQEILLSLQEAESARPDFRLKDYGFPSNWLKYLK